MLLATIFPFSSSQRYRHDWRQGIKKFIFSKLIITNIIIFKGSKFIHLLFVNISPRKSVSDMICSESRVNGPSIKISVNSCNVMVSDVVMVLLSAVGVKFLVSGFLGVWEEVLENLKVDVRCILSFYWWKSVVYSNIYAQCCSSYKLLQVWSSVWNEWYTHTCKKASVKYNIVIYLTLIFHAPTYII